MIFVNMIKLKSIFLFINLVIISCSSLGENNVISEKEIVSTQTTKGVLGNFIFLGYRNKIPVFKETQKNKLFTLKNSQFNEFITYESQLEPIFINSFCVLYLDQNGRNKLLIEVANNKKEFLFEEEIISIMADERGEFIYFSGISSPEGAVKKLNVETGEILELKVSGLIQSINDNYLYLYRTPDDKIIYPNVDLYKVKLSELSKETLVISNISGEATYVFPNQKNIACQILNNGGFRSILWDIGNKSSEFIDVGNEYMSLPYYSYEKECLVYYKSEPFTEKCVVR